MESGSCSSDLVERSFARELRYGAWSLAASADPVKLAVSGALVAVVLNSSSCLSVQRPTASATMHWATIDVPRGGYCWNSGGQAACADSAGADQLLKTGFLKPYRMAGGSDVRINFQAASKPTAFKVQLVHSPDGKRTAVHEVGSHTFSLGMSPPATTGVYVYVVTRTWPEGDVDFS